MECLLGTQAKFAESSRGLVGTRIGYHIPQDPPVGLPPQSEEPQLVEAAQRCRCPLSLPLELKLTPHLLLADHQL